MIVISAAVPLGGGNAAAVVTVLVSSDLDCAGTATLFGVRLI